MIVLSIGFFGCLCCSLKLAFVLLGQLNIEELLNPVVKSGACALLLTQVDALLVSLVQAISEGVTLEYLLEVLNSEPVRFLFGIGEPVAFAIGVEIILASLEFELVCPE